MGKVLRSCGAFFIRREWGDDILYKALMEEYIATLLSQGSKLHENVCDLRFAERDFSVNLECFVEGTRSRLGTFSDLIVSPINPETNRKVIDT